MKDYLNILPKNLIYQGNLDPVKIIGRGHRNEGKRIPKFLKIWKEKTLFLIWDMEYYLKLP